MKFLPVLLVLLLSACATDPYQEIQRAQADIAATQRAQVQAEQARVERDRQATQEAMEQAQAAQAEIDLMNAQADATMTALDQKKASIDLAALASESTRAAWEMGLSATQTLQAVQATQTVFPLEATAAFSEQQSATKRSDALATAIPAMLAIVAGIIIIAGVWLIIWIAGKVTIDLSGRYVDKVVVPSRRSAALETDNGTLKFDQNATIHSRDTDRLQDFNQHESQFPTAPTATLSTHDNDIVLSDDAKAAVYLLLTSNARAQEDDEENQILRYNRLGYGAERWEKVVNWLKSNNLVYTNSTGTYLLDGSRAYVVKEIKAGRLPRPTG